MFIKRRTNTQIDELKEMNEIEFRQVFQQAKKRSTSSTFSKRDYSVCECAMKIDRMVEVLVKFYNIIMKHNHFLNIWLDFLDVTIEKGKGKK